MTVYIAKAIGFALAYYAKKTGHCHIALMRFKVAETVALVLAGVALEAGVLSGFVGMILR